MAEIKKNRRTPSIIEAVIKNGSEKEKEKCLEVLVLCDEKKNGDDKPEKTELRVISRLRNILFHPDLAYTVKFVRTLFPLGSASFVLKAALLFTSHILMGWGFYGLDIGTDISFCLSTYIMKRTGNWSEFMNFTEDLSDVDGKAFVGTQYNISQPIFAVKNDGEFGIATIISVAHVGISIFASMVLFISTECGKFTKDSLNRLPIPVITKVRAFWLEFLKLKLFKEKRSDDRTKKIKKMERKIQKHSDWINLSLMTEAATESSFQFVFQSIMAMPATLGLIEQNNGSVDDLLTLQNFSIAASFVSFGLACVSIRYLA